MSHDLYSHAKFQGQWSVGSTDRVEKTDGRTEAIALPLTLVRSIKSTGTEL